MEGFTSSSSSDDEESGDSFFSTPPFSKRGSWSIGVDHSSPDSSRRASLPLFGFVTDPSTGASTPVRRGSELSNSSLL